VPGITRVTLRRPKNVSIIDQPSSCRCWKGTKAPSHFTTPPMCKCLHAAQILFVINQPDVYKSPASNTWM
jgi:hypothetical protein